MTKTTEFYHKDILKVFPEIKPRTLISWVEKGLVEPMEEPENRGGKRIYSYRNLVEIALIRELTTFGVPLKLIRQFLKNEELESSLARKNYDQIFYVNLQLVRTVSSADKKIRGVTSFPGIVDCVPSNKFSLKHMGRAAFGRAATSGLWISIKMLRNFIDESLG